MGNIWVSLGVLLSNLSEAITIFKERIKIWMCAGRKFLTNYLFTLHVGLSCLPLTGHRPFALRHDSQAPEKVGHATLFLVRWHPVHGVQPHVVLQGSAKDHIKREVMTRSASHQFTCVSMLLFIYS